VSDLFVDVLAELELRPDRVGMLSGEAMAETVRALLDGDPCQLVSPMLAAVLLDEFNFLAAQCEPAGPTGRELEVLRLVAKNMTTRQIADSLYISPATVYGHLKSLRRKLHVHSRLETVTLAVRDGLLDGHIAEP